MSPDDALANALGIGAGPASFGDVWAAFSDRPIGDRPARGVTASIAKAAGVSQREVQRWRAGVLGTGRQARRLPSFRLGRLSDAARNRVVKQRLSTMQQGINISFQGSYHVSDSERRNPFDRELDPEIMDRLAELEADRIVEGFYAEAFDAYGGLGNLVTVDDVESLVIQ